MRYFQSFCKSIGNYACYLLCLIDVAKEYSGKNFDKIEAIQEAIEKDCVYFNEDDYDDPDNFYVRNPAMVLRYLTGKVWIVTKEPADYKPKKGDYVIEYWSLNGGKSGHFARIKKGFNSLQNSVNVNKGKIHSYRVCRVVE